MKRISRGELVLNRIFYILLAFFIIICAYPIWYVIVASVSDGTYVNSGKLILLPVNINFASYEFAFSQKALWVGYGNTLIYTIIGTLFGVAVSLPCGYALSRKDMFGRGIIMGIITFTMYFSGGMIPTYIVCSTLHLTNTRTLLIMLGSVTGYNIILIRTFCMSGIPEDLREAAMIDGCSNTRFFFEFVIPLSKAIIAVISLYIAVTHWNNYYNALVYTNKIELQPLQLYLRQLLLMSTDIQSILDADVTADVLSMSQTARYAVIVLSALPIMCLYPFLQKYFVQGVMIGSIKG